MIHRHMTTLECRRPFKRQRRIDDFYLYESKSWQASFNWGSMWDVFGVWLRNHLQGVIKKHSFQSETLEEGKEWEEANKELNAWLCFRRCLGLNKRWVHHNSMPVNALSVCGEDLAIIFCVQMKYAKQIMDEFKVVRVFLSKKVLKKEHQKYATCAVLFEGKALETVLQRERRGEHSRKKTRILVMCGEFHWDFSEIQTMCETIGVGEAPTVLNMPWARIGRYFLNE